MKILFLSFYFEPDLCAGSFRNTPLFKELLGRINKNDYIHVVTTQPNRYHSFRAEAKAIEAEVNYRIDRVTIPEHKSGFVDQAKSFYAYYKQALKLVKNEKFDLVYASSSRLFTAFLGRRLAVKNNCPLYLDIRDIFVDTMKDVLGSKKIIRIPAVLVFRAIERYTFSRATHINLVSEGFKSYFSKYRQPNYTYFTNGIDDLFIDNMLTQDNAGHSEKIITYAGNIGSGQGLEKIVPQAAKKIANGFRFRIIGDGGTKKLLMDKISELDVKNVELLNPVSREELIKYYSDSDFLFLHLNDLDAFKKVLPSKLFEYVAFGKPIIAGVGGYAADFIESNLDNYILFTPANVDDFVNRLVNFKDNGSKREAFIAKFARRNIMKSMAQTILSCK